MYNHDYDRINSRSKLGDIKMSNLNGKSAINILKGLIDQFNNVKNEIDIMCKAVASNKQDDIIPTAMKKGVDFCIMCLEEKLQRCKDLREK